MGQIFVIGGDHDEKTQKAIERNEKKQDSFLC